MNFKLHKIFSVKKILTFLKIKKFDSKKEGFLLKKYTVEDIRKLNPCYDPVKKGSKNAELTLIQILQLEHVAPLDKIWVVTRFLSDKQNRLFAVWCAREALKLVDKPDQRSIDACDVAERFAYGEATEEDLKAAWCGARAAGAAWSVAKDAACASTSINAADTQVKKLIEIVESECKNEFRNC